ncbi:MAG: acetamidase/formamidase family protein [Caldilineaceae bacterium]
MTFHTIDPTIYTLHGAFSRDIPPALTIDPGDTVRFRTLDADWNLEPRQSTNHLEKPRQFTPRPAGQETGHALCGPLAIRGAEPGMTLAVTIQRIEPGRWGFTSVGGWPHVVNTRLGVATQGTYLLWTLDPTTMQGRNQYGQTVALRPFMGVMGMPPAEPGLHSTVPPRVTGGNLDCKELVAGSTLYLPIRVPGGLFSLGDGHARQGDGESCVTAIECPMDCVECTFDLLPDLHLTTPRAHTPAGWITFGLHEDLNEAALIALEAMVAFMMQQYNLERHQAFGLASVVVDLRITQIVNGVRGVHAVLPHGAIATAGLPIARQEDKKTRG